MKNKINFSLTAKEAKTLIDPDEAYNKQLARISEELQDQIREIASNGKRQYYYDIGDYWTSVVDEAINALAANGFVVGRESTGSRTYLRINW